MVKRGIKISVERGDILTFEADVLALKYADTFYGVDEFVAQRLVGTGIKLENRLPKRGEHLLLPSQGCVASDRILFVGVEPLWKFRYKEIREFARKLLKSLAIASPETKHICLTIHGPGYGLDEIEAFSAEIAGLIDSITNDDYPKQLQRITIVERDSLRFAIIQNTLPSLIPHGVVDNSLREHLQDLGEEASETFRSVGYASESKKHIFVAMPFIDNMEDIYHYGILGAVKKAGFLCERADLSSFTGDILEWIKKRIESASLVIADLTNANPNVYLEVGYAWGCDKPTILLVKNTNDLKFDVQNQRCLVYNKIRDLEELLSKELIALNDELSN